jgi:hypothetical protein
MKLVHKLFNNSKVNCPRCLGKGHVDWDDIERLEKKLKWIPGDCAYCNGKGEVHATLVSKIAVDHTYLTTDLPEQERKRIINGDKDALERGHVYDSDINNFIQQVEFLHFNGGLDINKIIEFYFIPKSESEMSPEEKKDFIAYISKIIEHKKENEKRT